MMPHEVRRFLRAAAAFAAIGLVLYLAVYVASERLVSKYAQRNRFFMVKTAQHREYDYVILGASHAAVFDYQDMNARLEQMTGARIINLSVVGAGPVVNRLLLDYFLEKHRARAVVYVVDSFAFYSPDWNEARLEDAQLFHRAPFDPALARLLVESPAPRSVALDYISGFSKINNANRFKPDVRDEEGTRFARTYRAVRQIDEQRIAYLYPPEIDEAAIATRRRYLAQLEDLIRAAKSRGMRVVAIKPPIPERVHRLVPDEAGFDAMLKEVLSRQDVMLHDFSHVGNDEKLFYDTDHLNRTGVLEFFANHLQHALR